MSIVRWSILSGTPQFLFNEFEYYKELAHFQPTPFCGYLHAIHEVNTYNWLIPSVNISFILNTSFVYSFLILHIDLTEYKRILSEFRTLAYKYIFQTNNIILMKFGQVLHNEMTNQLKIWSFYRHIIRTWNPDFGLFEVSDFRSGDFCWSTSRT